MGELVAKRYPTNLAAGLADHTYVECGTGGRAWGCWGGKTGGTELRRGGGSTLRADRIAGTDERGSAGHQVGFPAELPRTKCDDQLVAIGRGAEDLELALEHDEEGGRPSTRLDQNLSGRHRALRSVCRDPRNLRGRQGREQPGGS